MKLGPFDTLAIIIYFLTVFLISYLAGKFIARDKEITLVKKMSPIEAHYLAGHSLTLRELIFSIFATEFSAFALIYFPSYVFFDNFHHLKFILGAMISRFIIARFFLPKLYGKGLTIFEILAKGIKRYKNLTRDNLRARKLFAVIYLASKAISVSVKLFSGAFLLSHLLDANLFFVIFVISIATYICIILGGLKAVVRTDIFQGTILILTVLLAHYFIPDHLNSDWFTLFSKAWGAGKLSLVNESGMMIFFLGIFVGAIYDLASYGVDQDCLQKLLAAENEKVAERAIKLSAFVSLFMNVSFLLLGVILWSGYEAQFTNNVDPVALFEVGIFSAFPDFLKVFIIISIIAATMSTLDSSINAMSTCLWNDCFDAGKYQSFKLFINLDNFIITVSIMFLSYLTSLIPGDEKGLLTFSYFSSISLLGFFFGRLYLINYIQVGFYPALVVVSILSAFMGISLNYFKFQFDSHLTVVMGLISSLVGLLLVSKINKFTYSKGNIE